MKKRLLAILMTAAMLLMLVPTAALAADTGSAAAETTAAASGDCGENLTWGLDDSGTLTVSGTGEMPDYNWGVSAPWSDIRSEIKTVQIEQGVANIGGGAFGGCENLTTVSIADSVKSIDSYAFCFCSSLTEIMIPASVTEIGDWAFCSCTSLVSAAIPASVTTIGMNAFVNCTSLVRLSFPASVTSIGSCAFANCDKLADSNGLIIVRNILFGYCGSAETVVIPSYVTKIDQMAFMNNQSRSQLRCVVIPSSVVFIDEMAFSNCSNLNTVYYTGTIYQWNAIQISEENDDLINAYKIYNFQYNIGEFGDCGENLSWYMDNLGTLTINGTGAMTAYDGSEPAPWADITDKIAQVQIAPGVTNISACAFGGCQNLTSVVISDSVTSIDGYAFAFCTALRSITIPDSVTIIDERAFLGCSGLGSIVIPDSVTTIGEAAFANCTNLCHVEIPDSVTSIGWCAFSNCSNLADGDGFAVVKNILYGYYGSAKLVVLPDGVKKIEDMAFDKDWVIQGISNPMTEIYIPASVASIGEFVFDNCTNLTDVYYAGTETQWSRISVGDCNEPLRNASIHYEATPYSDIQPCQWYTFSVLWAASRGITTGYSDGTFRPQTSCTRGQIVTFLWRAMGSPEPESLENPFSDVSTKSPYYKAILWAVEQGITTGYSDGSFRPNQACTRAQAVTFIYRAAGSPAVQTTENPFKDVSESSKMYKAILWASENGITSGYSDNTFRPNNTCNRSQIVTFLYRADQNGLLITNR